MSRSLTQRLCFAAIVAVACTQASASTVIPERYNQGPRILFNTGSDKDKLNEIVPDRFYQKILARPSHHGAAPGIQTRCRG